MAALKMYVCSKCGFEIMTTPQGHYTLGSGEHFNFHCHNCSNIVLLSAEELVKAGVDGIKCPECGHSGDLYSWNPIDGVCPECGIGLKEDSSMLIMAD